MKATSGQKDSSLALKNLKNLTEPTNLNKKEVYSEYYDDEKTAFV